MNKEKKKKLEEIYKGHKLKDNILSVLYVVYQETEKQPEELIKYLESLKFNEYVIRNNDLKIKKIDKQIMQHTINNIKPTYLSRSIKKIFNLWLYTSSEELGKYINKKVNNELIKNPDLKIDIQLWIKTKGN